MGKSGAGAYQVIACFAMELGKCESNGVDARKKDCVQFDNLGDKCLPLPKKNIELKTDRRNGFQRVGCSFVRLSYIRTPSNYHHDKTALKTAFVMIMLV